MDEGLSECLNKDSINIIEIKLTLEFLTCKLIAYIILKNLNLTSFARLTYSLEFFDIFRKTGLIHLFMC